MVLVPGNLQNARSTCGQAGCHDTVIPRVGRSIMTTMAGVVSVDRKAFGEHPGAEVPHVLDLQTSSADSHQRQLCASCHLGQAKTAWGPIGTASRGGGCNACHLVYTEDAARQLSAYAAQSKGGPVPAVHPALKIDAGPEHCFGCHSRSSRIATNYEGWRELAPAPNHDGAPAPGTSAVKRLDDGRRFAKELPDVHFELGLGCIDCHPVNEVMGRGATVARKSDQVRVQCQDCHAPSLKTIPLSHADAETFELLRLRNRRLMPDERLVTTSGGDVLTNVTLEPSGDATLQPKAGGPLLTLRTTRATCGGDNAHRRLSCNPCHTAWAPRCVSCHTSFDPRSDGFDHLTQQFVKGEWQETAGAFEAGPPTLGVRLRSADPRERSGTIDTFVPGMVMALDRNRDPSWPPDPIVRRWYAPISAHTTRREGRSCVSCHNDPVALGLGRGVLRFVIEGGSGHWVFKPARPTLDDGLPADAWTGFLADRAEDVSSHSDVRPFSADEQKRILRVGACLTCHDGASSAMHGALQDFPAALRALSGACVDYLPR
jgi:hypothetical protein